MIFYRPTDGDVLGTSIAWKPRTCFVMSQLAVPLPPRLLAARRRVNRILDSADYKVLDADSQTTGKDFLLKIWQLAASCPVGIAIVHEGIQPQTLANIYYELGLMQAYGRETVVVKVGSVQLPSDFVRTEYIPVDGRFADRFARFIASMADRARYYVTLGEQLEKNPLLAIDYLRRAYLLSGDRTLRKRARRIFDDAGLANRGHDSVERLMCVF